MNDKAKAAITITIATFILAIFVALTTVSFHQTYKNCHKKSCIISIDKNVCTIQVKDNDVICPCPKIDAYELNPGNNTQKCYVTDLKHCPKLDKAVCKSNGWLSILVISTILGGIYVVAYLSCLVAFIPINISCPSTY